MAENEISDYFETDASNVDIAGISVQENVMRAPAVNNAFRALQGALKRWFKSSLFRLRDSTDQTKLLAFDLSAIPTATTVTLTAPVANGSMATTGLLGNRPTLANDGTDPTNDIVVSTGVSVDTNAAATGLTAVKCASLIKRLDANWAAGTNQGMRYSGAAIANATYHIWACWTDAGVQDYYADTSAVQATVLGHLQAETGGSAYTHLGYVGSVVRISGAILLFTQVGRKVVYTTSVLDLNALNPGGGSPFAVNLTVPLGKNVLADVNATSKDSLISAQILVTSIIASAETLSASNQNGQSSGAGYSAVFTGSIVTNTSTQIRVECPASVTNTVTVRTYGFTYLD